MRKIKIGIIGIGMVGTPLKRWFIENKSYERGKDLFCLDKHVEEYSDDISKAKIVFVCVPTPSNKDGSCDISIVESVVKDLPDGKNRDIVIKSTVLPGTTKYLSEKYKTKGYFFFNPEFLREANPWEDFKYPDRQIVAPAKINKESKERATKILSLLPRAPRIGSFWSIAIDSTEAEVGKNAANFFLAMKVTLFNILFDRCKIIGADYEKVCKILTSDKRIGAYGSEVLHNLYRGFGGSCFTKDIRSVIFSDEKLLKKMDCCSVLEYLLFAAAVDLEKGMSVYNRNLLALQGLTPEDVSAHDSELLKKLKKEKNRND